jgi:hypothetical protein
MQQLNKLISLNTYICNVHLNKKLIFGCNIKQISIYVSLYKWKSMEKDKNTDCIKVLRRDGYTHIKTLCRRIILFFNTTIWLRQVRSCKTALIPCVLFFTWYISAHLAVISLLAYIRVQLWQWPVFTFWLTSTRNLSVFWYLYYIGSVFHTTATW